ncbi:hypothetical protein L6J37_10730 [Photobacterium sp. WH77]|uniref:hypothetical protein n=1 Tax=unclassified Photobacterium TaxID=2628852 RepID=UPI001EDBABBD|nr:MULTISPECIES: hypothetical protein [unclassified Photobacterium]MCG2837307.1 hypothetical protein [Photobacterium sp. WH77]MCG2844923.1 hypothetical protein [Photobacterium sp. WH80]
MSQYFYVMDLAKHSFSIHGEDHQGKILIHKTITRSKILKTFANIPQSTVGMEACGAYRYWLRGLAKLYPKDHGSKICRTFQRNHVTN